MKALAYSVNPVQAKTSAWSCWGDVSRIDSIVLSRNGSASRTSSGSSSERYTSGFASVGTMALTAIDRSEQPPESSAAQMKKTVTPDFCQRLLE